MILSSTQDMPVALITGAARRIGACIATYLQQHGFRVVLHYHQSEQAAHNLADGFNHTRKDSAMVVQADLLARDLLPSLIDNAYRFGGRLDLLVNNAAVFIRTSACTFDEQAWDDLFAVNVKAPLILSQLAYPCLSQTGGCIVNITDLHAVSPMRGYGVYCQSKAALLMQTKVLAKEFAPKVRVNAVAPGAMLWPEGENSLADDMKQRLIDKTPLHAASDPRHIAQAVYSFYQNTFVTGQVLTVDGGRSLG